VATPVRLGKPGWLQALVRDAVARHKPVVERPALKTPHARARAWLRRTLRESGLAWGTPLAVEGSTDSGGPEEVLFQAVLRTFCKVALDLADLAEAAPGPRPEQLLLLFTALINRLDDATDIHQRIEKAWKQWPLPEKLWRRVEEALEARAPSFAADPYYGLVLHNGAVYADANVFGRLALAYFTRSSFPVEAAQRRLHFAAQQKARLVEVLVGLVCAERKPSFPTRRAILRQIADLQLPDALAESTTEFARRAFEKPPSLKRLTAGVRSRDLRRFILEQTVLASLVDGHRSPREVEWTHELGAALGFSRDEVKQLELAMADFYKSHRNVVDVFTLSEGADVMGEEWVEELSTNVRKNSRAVMKEIKKTGELSVLLARAARGQTLTSEEKARMREQLINVAKAVPSLAMFAAPGGLVLLLALAKVLPFDLLPSSFRDDDEH
jgi:DnaJ-domain-containing protein 1